MTAKIFSGLLVDSEQDWSLRVEEGVLVVLGDKIVERAGSQDLESLADRLYFLWSHFTLLHFYTLLCIMYFTNITEHSIYTLLCTGLHCTMVTLDCLNFFHLIFSPFNNISFQIEPSPHIFRRYSYIFWLH